MARAEQHAITLMLTPEEASVLAKILANVGGDPQGPRGRADQIQKALMDFEYPRIKANCSGWSGSIRCPDHPATAKVKTKRATKNADIVSVLRAELPILDSCMGSDRVRQSLHRLKEVLDD